jgi:hypothetical protein
MANSWMMVYRGGLGGCQVQESTIRLISAAWGVRANGEGIYSSTADLAAGSSRAPEGTCCCGSRRCSLMLFRLVPDQRWCICRHMVRREGAL